MSNDNKDLPSTSDTLHTCSYACERPGCIRAQRDYLAARLAAIETDSQCRGEPVAWPLASPEEADKGWILDYRFIEQVERIASQRTNYTTSMEATEQVLIAANEVLRALQPAAPQPPSAYAYTVPDDCETIQWRGQILSMNELASVAQPAEGEEIMVNAAHDVYTLPLQPSGLSSGPRFVVHVPGPEQQPAAPDVEVLVGALREEIKRLLDSREREGDRLDWLLAQLPGDVIRDLVGEMNCPSDVAEWRHRIDKAARFNPRPGEFGG